jgi:hypothetical protein
MVKDALRLHGEGRACNIVVGGVLLQKARGAYSKYKDSEEKKWQIEMEKARQAELEQKQRAEEVAKEEKRAEMMEAHKKAREKIQQQEIELLATEKEQHNILKSAEVLLKESESKLGDAIKVGDVDLVSVAHGLLEVARTRTASATKELCVVAKKRKKCAEKLKLHTIESDGQNETTKKAKH